MERWDKSMGQISTRLQIYDTPDKVVLLARNNLGNKWDLSQDTRELEEYGIKNAIYSSDRVNFTCGVMDIIGFDPQDGNLSLSNEVNSKKDLEEKCTIVVNSKLEANKELEHTISRFISQHKLSSQTKVVFPEWMPGALDGEPYRATGNLMTATKYGINNVIREAIVYHLTEESDSGYEKALELAEKTRDSKIIRNTQNHVDKKYRSKAFVLLDGIISPQVDYLEEITRLANYLAKLGYDESSKKYTQIKEDILKLAEEDFRNVKTDKFKAK